MFCSKFGRRLAVCAALLIAVGVTGGCASPEPVHSGWPRLDVSITVPPGSLTSGANATFSAHITGGIAPYSVTWDFGGGAVPNNPAAENVASSLTSITVKPTAGDWVAKVTVTDSIGVPFTTPVAGGAYHVDP